MPDTHNGADIAAPNVAVVYHWGSGTPQPWPTRSPRAPAKPVRRWT